jgi:hypothetical protein
MKSIFDEAKFEKLKRELLTMIDEIEAEIGAVVIGPETRSLGGINPKEMASARDSVTMIARVLAHCDATLEDLREERACFRHSNLFTAAIDRFLAKGRTDDIPEPHEQAEDVNRLIRAQRKRGENDQLQRYRRQQRFIELAKQHLPKATYLKIWRIVNEEFGESDIHGGERDGEAQA